MQVPICEENVTCDSNICQSVVCETTDYGELCLQKPSAIIKESCDVLGKDYVGWKEISLYI